LSCVFVVIAAPNLQAAEPALSRGVAEMVADGAIPCARALDVAIKDTYGDVNGYAFVTAIGNPPDKAGTSLITAIEYSDGNVVRNFYVTPDQSGGCTVQSTQVYLTDKNCPAVRDETFKEWKVLLDMGKTTAYERDQDRRSTVMLMPHPAQGCTIVKSSNFNFSKDTVAGFAKAKDETPPVPAAAP
jgi:hypothetical protein